MYRQYIKIDCKLIQQQQLDIHNNNKVHKNTTYSENLRNLG